VAEARTPVDPGPARWHFPDPATAGPDGLVGVGADLEPQTLVFAYRHGIFPWPQDWSPGLPWYSPDPRGVIPLGRVRVTRSLRQRLRHCGWEATVDADFPAVIAACAHPHRDAGTWITPAMQAAYVRLHRLGWAHSVEVWEGDELVGGLYGVLCGGVFTGESMFHRRRDASKVALVELEARLVEAGASLIDVQIATPHLASLGAVEIPRSTFLRCLAEHRDDRVALATDRRPVSRLAAR
jgi:leucyl/phenylalanyl-tRNA--protein transferase